MKLVFTLDDGLKSQLKFFDKTRIRGTYFVVPSYTDLKHSHPSTCKNDICMWNEVRFLRDHGEIGYHGYSAKTYDAWEDKKIIQNLEQGMNLFQEHIGQKPVSFAYTEMKPGRIDMVSRYIPYIRDLFWRDYANGEFIFRVTDNLVPEQFVPYRSKIFVMHPYRDVIVMLKKLKEMEKEYEHCILIYHELDDALMKTAKIIGIVYETVTFREIFE